MPQPILPRRLLFVIIGIVLVPFADSAVLAQTAADSTAILRSLDSWDEGWRTSNAELAVQSYAADADWTNAFGDRVVGRDSLEATLRFIFGLNFVMAGDSGENEFADLTFLTPNIALLRSKLVRVGQQMQSGATMPDRHVHHLRVFERRGGEWQIVSHLISQAHEKR